MFYPYFLITNYDDVTNVLFIITPYNIPILDNFFPIKSFIFTENNV